MVFLFCLLLWAAASARYTHIECAASLACRTPMSFGPEFSSRIPLTRLGLVSRIPLLLLSVVERARHSWDSLANCVLV